MDIHVGKKPNRIDAAQESDAKDDDNSNIGGLILMYHSQHPHFY